MEMKKYKLGEIGEIRMCKRILKEETNTVSGVPFYKIGTFGSKADVYITKEKFEEYKNKFSYPEEGDILISAAGTIGRAVIYDGSDSYFQDSNIVWIDNDETKVLNKYLFYCYKNIHWFTSKGSTILRLYNDNIRNTEIVVPPLPTQQKIAAVLSAIDKKISINREINRNLEALSKQLYDYYFVQFEFPGADGKPYKSSGGKMEYNATLKREIPAGWEVKSINDISTSARGVSYTADDEKSNTDENVVLILRGNNIANNHIVFDGNTVYVDSAFVSQEQRIKKFDIVITMSSGSKEHIGKSAMFLFDSEHSYGAFCNKITPAKDYQFFLENYLHSDFFAKYIRQSCSGTGINNLTNAHFDKALFAFSPENILKLFNNRVDAIYSQCGIIEQENLKLTALRDYLLPLLMNGQVSVITDNVCEFCNAKLGKQATACDMNGQVEVK